MKQIKENDKLRREITAIRRNRLHRRWQKAVTIMASLVLLYTVSVLVQPASALVGESKAEVGIQEEAEDTNDTAELVGTTDTESGTSQDVDSDDEISSKDDPEPSEDDADVMTGGEAGDTGSEDPEATSGTGSSEANGTKDTSEDGGTADPEPSQETEGSEIIDPEPESGNTGSDDPAAPGSEQSVEEESQDTGSDEVNVPESVEDQENAADGTGIAQDAQDGNGSGEAAAGGASVVTEEVPTEVPVEAVPALEDEYFKGTLRYIEPGDYRISVAITEDAQIPKKPRPRLKVEELEPGSKKYQDHYEKAEKEILDGTNEIKFARFFDITILSDEEEIEPEEGAGVDITITYAKQIIVPEDGEKLAVHFINDDEIEVLDATGDPEVMIEAEEDEEAEPAQQAPEEDTEEAIPDDTEEDIKPESEETEDTEAPFGTVEGSAYVAVNANGEVIDPEDHLTDRASAEDEDGSVPEEDEEEDAEGMFDEADFEGESDLYRFTFSQDSFSVVGTVVTGRLDTRFIDSAGDTWQIIASFGADAGIPGDAGLRVSEILQGNEKYADYYADARLAAAAKANVELDRDALKAELSSKIENGEPVPARFFDIKIVDGSEQPVQLAEGSSVKVEIYLTEENNFVIAEDTEVSTVHFGAEKTEVLGSTTGTMDGEDGTLLVESVEFSTESFSVFALVWGEEPNQKRATIHWGTINDDGTFNEFDAANLDTSVGSVDLRASYNGYEYADAVYYISEPQTVSIDVAEEIEGRIFINDVITKVTDGDNYKWNAEDAQNAAAAFPIAENSHIYAVYRLPDPDHPHVPTPSEHDDIPTPTTEKHVTPNENPDGTPDGTYTIELDITGAQIIETLQSGANVVLVFDNSNSMITNRIGGRTRLAVAQDAMETLVETLDPGTNDIDMSLVYFGTGATRAQYSGSYWTKDGSDITGTVNGLTASGSSSYGTNWHQALQYAYNLAADPPDDDPTYVIFITDGCPSVNSFANNNDSHGAAGTNNTSDPCYVGGLGYAKAIAGEKGTSYSTTASWRSGGRDYSSTITEDGIGAYLYGIYTGTDSTSLLNTLISSSGGVSSITATSEEAIKTAFENIAQTIVNSLGATGVTTTDGVTQLSSVSADVHGAAGAFEYYRKGGVVKGLDGVEHEKYDHTANGGLGVTWADAPGTIYNEDGSVTWDLSSIGQTEAKVTYVVRFTVWPSQEAYDIIANLNNEVVDYDDLLPVVQSQIYESGGKYYLKTNTTLNTSYTFQGTTYTDPVTFEQGQMVLDETQMNVRKDFANDINAQHIYDQIEFYLLRDGKYYQDDGTVSDTLDDSKVFKLPVDASNNWQNSVFIAPGVMKGGDILETGHKYSLDEKILVGNEYEYEFTPQIVRPMEINGVLTYLVLVDKYNPAPEGATAYYIDDDAKTYRAAKSSDTENVYYVVSGENEGTLIGTNRKTAELDITKQIVDNTGNFTEEQLDAETFTYRVTLTVPADADISGITAYEYVPRWDDPPASNRYIIFGYQNTEVGNVQGIASDVSRFSGKIYGGYTVTTSTANRQMTDMFSLDAGGATMSATIDITLKRKEIIRFTNLPADTEYTITEMYNNYRQSDPSRDADAEPSTMEANIADAGYETTFITKSRNPVTNTVSETNPQTGTTVTGTIDYLDVRYYNQFTNTLNDAIDVELTGTKHLDGYEWSGERYYFNLETTNDAPLPVIGASGRVRFYLTEASGSADKSYSFGKIRFTEAGTYTYTIAEDDADTLQIVNGKAVQYGAAETITIVIAADNDGKLSVESVTNESGHTAWDADNLVATTTITNTAPTTSVSATKAWQNADGTTEAPADASVTFTLYDEDGTVLSTVVLNGTKDEEEVGEGETWRVPTTGGYESDSWVATFVGLPMYKIVDGVTEEIKYTIGETEKWSGYELVVDDEHPHPVSNGGTITNKQVPKYVRFMKTNDNGDTLGGAEFTFDALEGNLVSEKPGTMDGNIDISGLLRDGSGKYTFELTVSEDDYVLSETVVPKGYYPPDGEVHISVGDNKVIAELIKDGKKTKEFKVTGTGTEAEPYVVTITNSTGAALPSTGGHGTLPYTLSGLMLIMASALMLGLRRKSKITV